MIWADSLPLLIGERPLIILGKDKQESPHRCSLSSHASDDDGERNSKNAFFGTLKTGFDRVAEGAANKYTSSLLSYAKCFFLYFQSIIAIFGILNAHGIVSSKASMSQIYFGGVLSLVKPYLDQ
ncbi:hypothetical protein EDC96DRAFT_580940 [Choanephora cucurbitarum]|nr:hypothetical protein EDC96DRAFT_580940 [Choanephora cucurbitarum]